MFTALRYLFKHILHDWTRSLLTIISVASIVCVYLMSRGLVSDIEQISQSTLNFPESLLLVMTQNSVFPSDSHLDQEDLQYYRSKIETQFGQNAIVDTIPMFYRINYVNGTAVNIAGADLDRLIEIARLEVVQGSLPQSLSEVLINQEYASLINSKIGDPVVVYGTTLTVSGIAESRLWRSALIILASEQVKQIYAIDDDFQVGLIELREGVNPVSVHSALSDQYKDDICCNIYLHDHYNVVSRNALQGFSVVSDIVQVIGFIIISFIAYNATALLLAEHQHETYLVRILGFSSWKLSVLLFFRTYILMLISLGLGLILGAVVPVLSVGKLRLALSGIRIGLTYSVVDVQLALVLLSVCTVVAVAISLVRNDPLLDRKMTQSLIAIKENE